MRRIVLGVLVAAAACGGPGEEAEVAGGETSATAAAPLDTTDVVATVLGFDGPEAVRFDPDQDVWFVASFGPGEGEPRDGDGYVSRMLAEGVVDSARFMTGTDAAPLHMPRGMVIKGDTLWVADVDGVHGFDRRDGRHLAFIDFRAHEPGFLNDIAAGPDGALYVTDTGRARVYRVAGAGGQPEIVADSLPAAPNGITWDAARDAFLLAPWGEGRVILSLTTAGRVDSVATVPALRFDGIERVPAGILVATQSDSSLWLVEAGGARRVVRTRGRPADIGYDARRGVVAVPYIALNRVDLWEVP
ncbi:MAG TPA: hypothetical protein VMM12_04855 [Longimicrobiales bacterium]|nr:hypothetical protein [Longimicrobiales bacterium]